MIRFAIFVALMTILGSSHATEGVDTWSVERSIDELEGTETITAQIVKPSILRDKAVAVRCDNGKLETFVIFGDYLNNSAVRVRYKFGNGEIKTERWSVSTTGIGVFANNPEILARHMMKGNRFVIEVTDYRGTPHQESFTLNGSSAAISQVFDACGVEEAKKNSTSQSITSDPDLLAEEQEERRQKELRRKYMVELKSAVHKHWKWRNAEDGNKVVVQVHQHPSGYIKDIKILSCSGTTLFCDAGVYAVEKAEPLPKPPDLSLFDEVIEFTFTPLSE